MIASLLDDQWNPKPFRKFDLSSDRHSDRITQITDAVMAELAKRGDDSFPFVWLLSDGSWTFGRDAAAE